MIPITKSGSCRIPTVFCCADHHEEVRVDRDEQYLGRIASPHICCAYEEMNVYDHNEILQYIISGSGCQPGVLAQMCCLCRCTGPCKFIQYKILNPQMLVVGEIKNIYHDCFLEMFTKADKFLIHFPKDATQNQKVLLTYATLLIDYNHFEGTCCL